MRLILAVDAIAPPLTGIGRYTWELATYYQRQTDLKALCFFSNGRWVDDPQSLLHAPAPGAAASSTRDRRVVHLSAPAWVRRWRLRRRMHGHVFHSPNYFLPAQVERGLVTVHDLSVFKYPETHPTERIRHFEQSFASTLQRADHLITDSEAIRQEVASYFNWPLRDITAISLGVSPDFRPRAAKDLRPALHEYGLSPGEYALCVSTLEPRKRIDKLLCAYQSLSTSLRRRYPLVLAGSKGWLSGALHAQINRGEQEGWLRYLGFVPESFLPLLYAGARAFLYPSVYEGFGLPVLEAMASGVPVLTSDSSSLPEVAGGAAQLVRPDDHNALAEGLVSVLDDDAWRAQAIDHGLMVATQHSWARCASETLALCRRFS